MSIIQYQFHCIPVNLQIKLCELIAWTLTYSLLSDSKICSGNRFHLSSLELISMAKVFAIGVIASLAVFSVSSSAPAMIVVSS